MEPVAAMMFGALYLPSLYTDIKYHLIKNSVTFPIMVIAIVLLAVQQGFLKSVSILAIALVLGLLPEFLKVWGSGDTKLFVAAGLCSALLLNTADFSLLLYFLGANVFLYLLIGHGYVLWQSKFNLVDYYTRFKTGYVTGRAPGTLPILLSNIVAIIFYLGVL